LATRIPNDDNNGTSASIKPRLSAALWRSDSISLSIDSPIGSEGIVPLNYPLISLLKIQTVDYVL
jgi:hypothetical protein